MRITFECPDNWAKRIEESAHEKGFIFANGEPNISLICRQALSLFLSKELRNDKNNGLHSNSAAAGK